jgi:hypothetical protein
MRTNMSLFMISRYCASVHKARVEDAKHGKKRPTDETPLLREVEKCNVKMDAVMGVVMFAFCFVFALMTYRHIALSRELRGDVRNIYTSPLPTNFTSSFARDA